MNHKWYTEKLEKYVLMKGAKIEILGSENKNKSLEWRRACGKESWNELTDPESKSGKPSTMYSRYNI